MPPTVPWLSPQASRPLTRRLRAAKVVKIGLALALLSSSRASSSGCGLRSTALKEAIENGEVKPIFFAYDKALITEESKGILQKNAAVLKRYPEAKVIIEGHCDERGTEAYNLALGDRRASAPVSIYWN